MLNGKLHCQMSEVAKLRANHAVRVTPEPEQTSRRFAHAASLPGAASAWRNRTGEFLSGLLFRSRRKRQSPKAAWCDETLAQAMSLRPRAPGLPHHRHPVTAEELLAGVILVLICMTSLVYVLWRSA